MFSCLLADYVCIAFGGQILDDNLPIYKPVLNLV